MKQFSVNHILDSLGRAQIARKNLISLHEERVPAFQWVIIVLLAIIIVFTLSLIESELFLVGAVIKSAFVITVISILVLLHEFDELRFYRGIIGKRSAQDVLDIMSNKM